MIYSVFHSFRDKTLIRIDGLAELTGLPVQEIADYYHGDHPERLACLSSTGFGSLTLSEARAYLIDRDKPIPTILNHGGEVSPVEIHAAMRQMARREALARREAPRRRPKQGGGGDAATPYIERLVKEHDLVRPDLSRALAIRKLWDALIDLMESDGDDEHPFRYLDDSTGEVMFRKGGDASDSRLSGRISYENLGQRYDRIEAKLSR